MEAVKGIPYGVARFEEVRNGNFYYVDKTMYLPLLEETGDYLSLNRPHGFGKSLFTSMMWAYYDMAQADKFDRMFGGLWGPNVWRIMGARPSNASKKCFPSDFL